MHEVRKLSDAEKWFKLHRAEIAVKGLIKHGFQAYYIPDRQKAVQAIMDLVPPEATISFGSSETLAQLGILDHLSTVGNQLTLNPQDKGNARLSGRRKGLTADCFLTSVNAMTMDGRLVNIDATGNRIASMVFGPQKVIIVAGVNKIVENLDAAIARARNVAAVTNAKKLGVNVPCLKMGRCIDCDSPERICKITVILDRCPTSTLIHVLVVGEDLGY